MPSILPDFEYDIFISYRHNDNRSGSITDLVNHIRDELGATIKTPLSIYFDTNPYDGLLENHDVDRSLAVKLKSILFIPILSQTYCDTSSFAWQNEFSAFFEQAQEDKLGLDIRLNNGNIASRILPIRIHDLDIEDTELIETKMGRSLRSIDFIFKSAGVNRPLQMQDRREDNDYNTFYRDQLNKVANAIKELINGIKYPNRVILAQPTEDVTDSLVLKNASEIESSIAVLPFRNISHDPSQEYFADGITENILMELSALRKLKVISRTSIMRYKNTEKSAPEIASELAVRYILEGSAQSHGNKVRINAQLIEATTDDTVWSKVFVESLDDIFEIQNNVAQTVASELMGTINPEEVEQDTVAPTKSTEAYDLFLKGRHAFNQWGVEGYKAASEYFKRAIELDPDFKLAYSNLASSYSARMSWNGDLSPAEAYEKIELYLNEAWQRGPTDNDYLTKAFIEFFIAKDFNKSKKLLLEAIEMNSNNSMVLYTYSYLLNMMGRFEEARMQVEKAKEIDPLTVAYYNYQTICYYLSGDYDLAIELLSEAIKLYPAVIRLYDFLGRVYLTTKEFKKAAEALERGLNGNQIRPPSMIAFLAIAYLGIDQPEKARGLLNELTNRSDNSEKGVNFYLVHLYIAMGDQAAARSWLEKAKQTNDIDLIWLKVDPLLEGLDNVDYRDSAKPDFIAAEKHILQLLEEKLPTLAYHNLEHITDVLQSSMMIADAEKITDEDRALLRLAVLLHDSGFIYGTNDHELRSTKIAWELLPQFGLSELQIESICAMIMATKIPQQPTSRLEKIICDADLDYLGREDFIKISQRLYEELKAQGIVQTEREWNLVQKTFFESHQYHTEFSKTNRANLKAIHFEKILTSLKNRT